MPLLISLLRSPRLWLLLLGLALTAALVEYQLWGERARLWLKQQYVDDDTRQASIWLPGYRLVDTRLLAGLEEAETSDLTYDAQRNSLYTVTGRQPQLIELSLSGEVLRRIPLLGFADPEGVEALGGGRLAIVDERRHSLTTFRLDDDAVSIDAAEHPSHDLGFAEAGNKGFEGIAWDAGSQRLLLAKEREPLGLFSLPFPGEEGVAGALQALPDKTAMLRDMSALSFDARTGHTLVLSDESRLLLEVDRQGEPVSFLSLSAGFNGLPSAIEQAEGVALDAAGTLYIIGEPNLLYIFRKHPESSPAQ